jgi:hypothetical protein
MGILGDFSQTHQVTLVRSYKANVNAFYGGSDTL